MWNPFFSLKETPQHRGQHRPTITAQAQVEGLICPCVGDVVTMMTDGCSDDE